MPKKPMRRIRRNGKITEDQLFSLENGFCPDGHTPDYGHPLISRLWERGRGIDKEAIDELPKEALCIKNH